MPTRTDEDGRTRAPRKQVEQTRRRKRTSGDHYRLDAAISEADMARYKFRWFNDSPTRLWRMTKEDDWEIVHQSGGEVRDESDMGSAVSVPVGANPDGSPLLAYLCRKRTDFWDADQEEKMQLLDRQLEQMRAGNDTRGNPVSDYVPSQGIRI